MRRLQIAIISGVILAAVLGGSFVCFFVCVSASCAATLQASPAGRNGEANRAADDGASWWDRALAQLWNWGAILDSDLATLLVTAAASGKLSKLAKSLWDFLKFLSWCRRSLHQPLAWKEAESGHHNLPQRAPLFGREALVEDVRGSLFSQDGKVVALTGPAGFGKSVVANEVARVFLEGSPGRLAWRLSSGSEDELHAAYCDLAKTLGAGSWFHSFCEIEALAIAIGKALAQHDNGDWLLIFDGAPAGRPSVFEPRFFPALDGLNGHILITSRSPAFEGWILCNGNACVENFPVPRLQHEDGVRMMRPGHPRAADELPDDEKAAAMELSELAVGVPGVLKRVHHLVGERRTVGRPFTDVLTRLKSGGSGSFPPSPGWEAMERELGSYFASAEAAEAASEAVGLLNVLGVSFGVAANRIPRSLLRQAIDLSHAEAYMADETIQHLINLGFLIGPDRDEAQDEVYYSMPRLLHAWGRRHKKHDLALAAQAVGKALGDLDVDNESTWWVGRKLHRHASSLAELHASDATVAQCSAALGGAMEPSGDAAQQWSSFAREVLSPLVWYMVKVEADLPSAEAWARKAVEFCKLLSRRDASVGWPSLRRAGEDLGWVLVWRGEPASAVTAFKEAAGEHGQGYEHGTRPLDGGSSQAALAAVRNLSGDENAAARLIEAVRPALGEAHGADAHALVIAIALRKLGDAKCLKSGPDGAAAWYEASLAMLCKLHGSEASFAAVATALATLGDLAEDRDSAGTVHWRSALLAALQRRYGADAQRHDIGLALHSLGVAKRKRGDDLAGSETLLEASLAMYRAVHGADAKHGDIARNLRDLGVAKEIRGDLEGAEGLYEASLRMYRAVYGADAEHGDIALSLRNLGVVREIRDDLDGAEGLLGASLAMYLAVHGAEAKHRDIAPVLKSLGVVKERRGDLDSAERLYESSLAMYRAVHGADAEHGDIALGLRDLGKVKANRGDLDSAERMLEASLAMYRAMHGADAEHRDIARGLRTLGSVREKRGDPDGAERSYEASLAMYQAMLGADAEHGDIARVVRALRRLRRRR